MTWVREADRIVHDCREMVEEHHSDVGKKGRRMRRAARLLERAADFYRRAGLGLMSHASLTEAAGIYATVGDQDDCKRCEFRATAINPLWSGEGLDDHE